MWNTPVFSLFRLRRASTVFLNVLEIPWALPGEQQYLKSIAHGGHYVVPSVGLNKPLHFEIQWVANKTNDTCAVAPGWRYGTKALELLSSLCSTCFGSRRWKQKKLTLWNFYQDSVPRVSDPGDMEQKLWNFYQDSVPHVSDSGDMEQSSETSIKTLFHMFRIPAIWNKVLNRSVP